MLQYKESEPFFEKLESNLLYNTKKLRLNVKALFSASNIILNSKLGISLLVYLERITSESNAVKYTRKVPALLSFLLINTLSIRTAMENLTKKNIPFWIFSLPNKDVFSMTCPLYKEFTLLQFWWTYSH